MASSERSVRERLADELRGEMARQKVTGRRLAEMIGRPQNTVNNQLSGETAIDPDILEAMCNALGMSTMDLYDAALRNGGWTVQMPERRHRPTTIVAAATTARRSSSTRRVSSGSNGQLMSSTRVLTREYLLTDNIAAA